MTLTANPYQASRPITDSDDLFGRKTEFQLIYQMLLSHESVNVMGTRRIGKSSFLRVLPQIAIQKRLFEKPVFDDRHVFAYIDMESQKTATPIKFLGKIAKQLNKRELDLRTDIQSYDDFEAELEQCREDGTRLILLLDEFDCVADNEQFDVAFFDMLRYYQQEDFLSYIVASSRRVKDVARSTVATSPFFNIFRFVHLGLLRDLEQKALIQEEDGIYRIFSIAFEGFVKEVEFSETGEKLDTFFAKYTGALVSITKYCVDKAIALKKA